jgi:tRNA threonylcarbamoyladenosine biosynthesis protein TsaB
MHVLAFDTAGPDCAAAVADWRGEEPTLLACRVERIGRGHADRLIPMIEAVLAEAHLNFGDLERIVVTTGPGSFTGVRIGIAAARALALALGTSAVGVSGLTALAWGASRALPAATVAATLDAGKGEVFVAAIENRSASPVLGPTAMSVAEAGKRLSAFAGPLLLAGAAAPLLATALPGLNPDIVNVDETPALLDVIALGLELDPADAPKPLYLRRPDAKPQRAQVLARA